jgi:hypothetical protein
MNSVENAKLPVGLRELPRFEWKCVECHHTRPYLRLHVLTHANNKRDCPVCNKTMTIKTVLHD